MWEDRLAVAVVELNIGAWHGLATCAVNELQSLGIANIYIYICRNTISILPYIYIHTLFINVYIDRESNR